MNNAYLDKIKQGNHTCKTKLYNIFCQHNSVSSLDNFLGGSSCSSLIDFLFGIGPPWSSANNFFLIFLRPAEPYEFTVTRLIKVFKSLVTGFYHEATVPSWIPLNWPERFHSPCFSIGPPFSCSVSSFSAGESGRTITSSCFLLSCVVDALAGLVGESPNEVDESWERDRVYQ